MNLTHTTIETENRSMLLERLRDLEMQDGMFGLMALNVRGFRKINAAYGHDTGDAVLVEVITRLQGILRNQDRLFHIAGDEFAILFTGIRNAQQVTLAANRIHSCFQSSMQLANHEIRIRLQTAACIYPDQGTNTGQLLQRLDSAMQQAQSHNQDFAFYDAYQEQHEYSDLLLESALGDALQHGQFELHFQPKIDLATRRTCGGEALARWQHPTLGRIPPDRFIPLLEQSDLVIPFTEWVLNAALRQCSDCRRSFGCLSVAVNLSARSLHHPQLADIVMRTMRLWDTEPGSLTVEITESAIMENPEQCLDTLHRLHAQGVRISIDDFGTGYSSLAYLQHLPANEVKIDKSFVLKMAEDSQAEKIVRSIIDLGHNLGLQVIAEGVEDQDTLERLGTLGCDQAQGYHIARPMPGEEMKSWLQESPWGIAAALQSCRLKA